MDVAVRIWSENGTMTVGSRTQISEGTEYVLFKGTQEEKPGPFVLALWPAVLVFRKSR